MTQSLHIVCTNRDAVNRLVAENPGNAANCGSCRQALLTAHAVEPDTARLLE